MKRDRQVTDIDSFFDILKEVCDELPDEFFRELAEHR
jgi:hypothetical protein